MLFSDYLCMYCVAQLCSSLLVWRAVLLVPSPVWPFISGLHMLYKGANMITCVLDTRQCFKHLKVVYLTLSTTVNGKYCNYTPFNSEETDTWRG